MLLFFHFLVLWGYRVQHFCCAQPGARRRERYCICQYLSWKVSVKSSLLFSNFGCCICKGSPFRLFRDHNSCRCAVWRPKIFSPYIDIVLLRLHFLVLWAYRGSALLFESRVALNTGLGGVGDVASAIISHEQTQSNRVCCSQTLDAVFSKRSPFRLFNVSIYLWPTLSIKIRAVSF